MNKNLFQVHESVSILLWVINIALKLYRNVIVVGFAESISCWLFSENIIANTVNWLRDDFEKRYLHTVCF